ncbi:50S ribosomal protein L18 [Ignicoccus pacificus DSM 13166]|uniref:Large ribosomal subunit protein uL18 n=1 Tax=Ignicoccus pacificus DSM 13166 TaxID=940294 RepID=A0A977KC69_9CREN|nr:50S ribosomal protein L18 [Ignicoccus pacificus DSM 13166]
MAHGPRYRVPRRRRREGKTDYHKRYRMVLSRHPRFVVRKSNKYVWVQVIEVAPEGDKVIAAAHSRELEKKYGWKGSGNSLPAVYLTGLLAALRAKKAGISYAAPDIGLHKPTKGARIFAAIKAANDAGLEVPVGEEVVPSEERIKGEHIAEYAKMLKENNPEEYNKRFATLLKKGFAPENYVEHFEEVKSKILEDYKQAQSA